MQGKTKVIHVFAQAFNNLSSEDAIHKKETKSSLPTNDLSQINDSFLDNNEFQPEPPTLPKKDFQVRIREVRKFKLAKNTHAKLMFPRLPSVRIKNRPKRFTHKMWITDFRPKKYVIHSSPFFFVLLIFVYF